MQRANIVQLGRTMGVVIIVVGIILAAWFALDMGEFASGTDQFRAFAQQSLSWLAFGAITYLAAELLDSMSS